MTAWDLHQPANGHRMTIASWSQSKWINWVVWLALMIVIVASLGWGARPKIAGLFFASGLAIGSLYALGGISIVVLYRATGVLNFSGGAAGAAGAKIGRAHV